MGRSGFWSNVLREGYTLEQFMERLCLERSPLVEQCNSVRQKVQESGPVYCIPDPTYKNVKEEVEE